MTTQQEFKGLTENECSFIGRVVEVPTKLSNGYLRLVIVTESLVKDANNQFTRIDQNITIFVEPDDRKQKPYLDYCEYWRQVQVKCDFRSWNENGHIGFGFFARTMQLGAKKFDPNAQNTTNTGSGYQPPMG